MSDSLPFSSQKPLIKGQTSNISFTGFYRFLGFVRNQTHTFPNNSGKTTAILVGDAYREPMLLLKMRGVTKDEIQFGADFMINSLYKGVNESLNAADIGALINALFGKAVVEDWLEDGKSLPQLNDVLTHMLRVYNLDGSASDADPKANQTPKESKDKAK